MNDDMKYIDNLIENIEKKAESNKNEIISEIKKYIDKKCEINKQSADQDFSKISKKEDEIDELFDAYDIFKSLSDRSRDNIREVFQTDSFLGFVSNGMQWDRIAGLREQAKRKIVNDDFEDLSKFRKLFVLLTKIYNEGYVKAPIMIISAVNGEQFTNEIHVQKGYESGNTVNELLLEGYINFEKDEVSKAIVSLM